MEGDNSLKLVLALKSDSKVSQLNKHDLIKNSDCVCGLRRGSTSYFVRAELQKENSYLNHVG